jgi:hypothetical protein
MIKTRIKLVPDLTQLQIMLKDYQLRHSWRAQPTFLVMNSKTATAIAQYNADELKQNVDIFRAKLFNISVAINNDLEDYEIELVE